MNFLRRKVKAVGGVYFLSIAIIMSSIFMVVVNLSFTSSSVSISEDIAHIVCTKVAIYLYQSNESTFPKRSGDAGIDMPNMDGKYYPVRDFKQIAQGFGITDNFPTTCEISWDSNNKIARLQFGPFVIKSGAKVCLRPQESIIEDY